MEATRAGFRGAGGFRAPGLPPTAGLPPNPSREKERKGRMGGIAPPFLKSQIRHWAPGLPPAKSGPGSQALVLLSLLARYFRGHWGENLANFSRFIS